MNRLFSKHLETILTGLLIIIISTSMVSLGLAIGGDIDSTFHFVLALFTSLVWLFSLGVWLVYG